MKIENNKKDFWLIILTKLRQEKNVRDYLLNQNFEVYLPLYQVVKQWSDRKKKIEVPLFNSIVFVKNEITNYTFFYENPLIKGVMKNKNKEFAYVRPHEIENIKIMLNEKESIVKINDNSLILENEFVEVIKGQFQGLKGFSSIVNNKHRIIIKIETINQIFCINLPKSHVRKIK